MAKVGEFHVPALIVGAGRPGAGKTSLAHALARALRCPAICRDEIKEGLVCTTGNLIEPGADLQLQATDVFFDALALLLGHGVTVVAEAAFQHKVWAPRLEPLRWAARVRIVLCEIDPERAFARRAARSPRPSPETVSFRGCGARPNGELRPTPPRCPDAACGHIGPVPASL